MIESQKMVPRGLEPRTLRLLAVRSNQLSYETVDDYNSCGFCKFKDYACSHRATHEIIVEILSGIV